MSDFLFKVVLTVSGVMIGALFQFFLSKYSLRREKFLSQRIECYVDFLRAVSLIAGKHKSEVDDKEGTSLILSARARIAVYGTPKVIAAFGEFEKLGGSMSSKEGALALIRVIHAMRKDTGSAAIGDDLISYLLYYRAASEL